MTVRERYNFATMAVPKAGAKQRRLSGAGTITERTAYISALDMSVLKGGFYNAEIIKAYARRMGVLPAPENRPPHLQSSLPQLCEQLQAEHSG